MKPGETTGLAAVDPKDVAEAVLGQGELIITEPAPAARGTADTATATPAPARRPSVISSVPGTEHRAASPASLRSRLRPSPREVDAPRRGRRGR